jgi:hypothetical protein
MLDLVVFSDDLVTVFNDFFFVNELGASLLHCALYAQASSWHHSELSITPYSSTAVFEGSYKRLAHEELTLS